MIIDKTSEIVIRGVIEIMSINNVLFEHRYRQICQSIAIQIEGINTMAYIDPRKIIETRIAESMGFNKYKLIMDQFRKVDVSADSDFQRTYNGFYRIRRNAEWRAAHYKLFEEIKNSNPTFETIIRTLYRETGNVEASFTSKMLATINADMPIWDRYVVKNLCLNPKGKSKEEQLQCAIYLYDQMIHWYDDFVKTENGRECIAEFDRTLPDYTWMSDVKKIDFFLWSKRD